MFRLKVWHRRVLTAIKLNLVCIEQSGTKYRGRELPRSGPWISELVRVWRYAFGWLDSSQVTDWLRGMCEHHNTPSSLVSPINPARSLTTFSSICSRWHCVIQADMILLSPRPTYSFPSIFHFYPSHPKTSPRQWPQQWIGGSCPSFSGCPTTPIKVDGYMARLFYRTPSKTLRSPRRDHEFQPNEDDLFNRLIKSVILVTEVDFNMRWGHLILASLHNSITVWGYAWPALIFNHFYEAICWKQFHIVQQQPFLW